MRLIYPIEITLDSSNVAASTESEYDSGTTYSSGDKVKVSYESDGTTPRTPVKIYESLADSNTGNYPPDNPDQWQDPGGSNRWKMFDNFLNTQTTADGGDTELDVEIDASNCDRVVLFNLDATEVELTLYDESTSPRSQVQNKVIDLSLSEGGYAKYIVEPIYIYADATLEVQIKKTSDAKCGLCTVGLSTYIGPLQWGVQPGLLDYSVKESGASGVYLNPGDTAKTLESVQARIRRGSVDAVYEDLVNARGQLTALEGNPTDTDYESLRLYGFIESWSITIDLPKHALLKMDYQGVI